MDELTAQLRSLLPPDWDLDEDHPESMLICPHGTLIEQDGTCPEGCGSPLRGRLL